MNPKTFMRYLPYYEEKLRQDNEKERQMLDVTGWANGVYISHAIAQLGKHEYPRKPLNLFGSELAVRETDESDAPKSSPADGFRAFAFVYNLERKKKLEKEVKTDA